MSHTPGPWEIEFDEYGGYDCITKGWHVKSKNQPIVTVDNGDGPNGEDNARLIAAAPDLLICCKNLVEQFHAYENGWLGDGAWRTRIGLPDDLRDAEAAINAAEARAEGQKEKGQ